MRVADYIFNFLADYGVTHVFMVSGGGAMYLNDALRKETRLKPICCHHEQAAAMAAEGYSRASGGSLGVVSVTSGPGGTNAITGLLGQWTDSIPALYISGQVKFDNTLASVPNSGLRQLGDQETNIIDIVKPITKYAKMITDPQTIQHELQHALFTALTGRPGPVWLDIPLDVQGAEIIDSVDEVAIELQKAKRPLIVAGHGIRISEGHKSFCELIERYSIPVVTTFNGFDLMPSNSNNFIGRIGILGSQAGNLALQNADLVICIGTRNNIRQVSHKSESFAMNAKRVIVDIDRAELDKKTVKGDILVHLDAYSFILKLLSKLPDAFKVNSEWRKWCLARKKKYPVVLKEYKANHPYRFIEELTKALPSDAVVVAGNGTACVGLFQAGIVKEGQRMFWNSGCASMGYELPAAVGAALSTGKQAVCIAGDGSIQMNIQELQTIAHHKLPIKIFVLNNNSYRSIEITQAGFCDSRFIGCNKESGVSFPDCRKIANAYGIKYFKGQIKKVLAHKGPAICEVVVSKDYVFAPKLGSQKMPDGTLVANGYETIGDDK